MEKVKYKIYNWLRRNKLMIYANALSNFRYKLVKLFFKNPYDVIYNDTFYKDLIKIDNDTNTSKILGRAVMKFFAPRDVLDVGCGNGYYINELYKKYGVDVWGVENSKFGIKNSNIKYRILNIDIFDIRTINNKYDLSMCIEVAEHIPKKLSERLVQLLTMSSNTILFSTSPPGQGGTDHINEKKIGYWIELFKKYNFYYDEKVTEKFRKDLNGCVFWIRNNLFIFRSKK